jgi:hypothetical protein
MFHRPARSFLLQIDDEDKGRHDQIDREKSGDWRPKQLSKDQPRVETVCCQERDEEVVGNNEARDCED